MTSLKELKNQLGNVNKKLELVQCKIDRLLREQENLQDGKKQIELEIAKRETFSFLGESSMKEEDHSWASHKFPWYERLKEVARINFGVNSFRPMQLEAINATMSNRDVILIMPTGGGKSFCFQAPALLSPGITLVVSPLLSLIEDQLLCLESLGISATKLNASSSKSDVKTVHTDMVTTNTSLKFLYVTPEKISKSKRFMAQLEKCYKANNLKRIVIDEVHCASQWGNDFRPDYKILGLLKRQFPNAPVLGLTATSTTKVTQDVKKILCIPYCIVFRSPLNRANLYYEVRRKPTTHERVINDMVSTIRKNFGKNSGSGIVYCFSCKDCETVCKDLCIKGISSAVYHARLLPVEKSRVHKKWINNKIQVICATIAFGMGINKPDVRFVIHHSLSKSVENYYQESGRAGRDGLPALCLLYFGFSDVFRQSTLVLTENTGQENLSKMVKYCLNLQNCRRDPLSSHFGEPKTSFSCSKACDICNKHTKFDIVYVTVQCKELMRIVETASQINKSLTGNQLVEAAQGYKQFKTSNSMLKSMSVEHVQRIIVFMILQGYFKEDFHFTPYTTISYIKPGPKARMVKVDAVKLPLPISPDTESSLGYEVFEDFWKLNRGKVVENTQLSEHPHASSPPASPCHKRCKQEEVVIICDDMEAGCSTNYKAGVRPGDSAGFLFNSHATCNDTIVIDSDDD